MNAYIHSLALNAAHEWALKDTASFGRFFDISSLDKSWLTEATPEDMAGLHALPTSPFQVNMNVTKDSTQSQKVTPVPSMAIGTITMILTGIADELHADLRVAMIAWGISDIEKAKWLAASSIEQRIGMASYGNINFRLRTSFRRLKVDAKDSTSQMACLMKILSANRTN